MKKHIIYFFSILILISLVLASTTTTDITDKLIKTTGNFSTSYVISDLNAYNGNYNITYTTGNIAIAGNLTAGGTSSTFNNLTVSNNLSIGYIVSDIKSFNELYNITYSTGNINTAGAITAVGAGSFATVDTGQGANELYDMDQNVLTTSAVTFVTVDTGQGANELYDMDQNVLTTSDVTHSNIIATNNFSTSYIITDFKAFNSLYNLTYSTGNFKTAGEITAIGAGSFATVDTGQGANELYDMDQNVLTTSAVTFVTVDTGQGANELYDMDQNVLTTSAVTFVTVDTGQGANELYDMDQNVLTTSDVIFNNLTVTNNISIGYFISDLNFFNKLLNISYITGDIKTAGNINVIGNLTVNGLLTTISDTDFDTDEVLLTSIPDSSGFIFIKEMTGKITAGYRLEGTNLIELYQNEAFTTIKDTASKYNIYYETDQVKIQNKVGDNKNIQLLLI